MVTYPRALRAGVRKPPRKEPAGGRAPGRSPRGADSPAEQRRFELSVPPRENPFERQRCLVGTSILQGPCFAPASSPRRRRERIRTCMGLFLSSDCFWVFLAVLCSERERPFFVPSPAIRFPERAEGVKGPKRLQSLAACRLSVACVSQRLDA